MTAVITENVVVVVSYRALVGAVRDTSLSASRAGKAHGSGVLLVADRGGVAVIGHDFEGTWLTRRVSAAVATRGQVAVEHGELSRTLTAIAKGARKADLDRLEVTLSHHTDADTATLEVGGYRVPLAARDNRDTHFPEPPAPDWAATATIERDAFLAMHTRVAAAVGTDTLLPLFTHVQARFTPDTLTLLATDRYRATRGVVPITGTITGDVLLPSLLGKLAKTLSGDVVTIGLTADQDLLHLTDTAGTTITLRPNTQDYPVLEHLIDFTPQGSITADLHATRQAMLRTLALHQALADRNSPMLITATPDTLTLTPGVTKGEATSPHLTATTTGLPDEQIRFGINPRYLADALAHLTGDTLHIDYTTPTQPIRLTDDNGTYQHIIMPMRIPT